MSGYPPSERGRADHASSSALTAPPPKPPAPLHPEALPAATGQSGGCRPNWAAEAGMLSVSGESGRETASDRPGHRPQWVAG